MGDLERFHGKSTRNPLQSDRDLLQFYGKSAHSLVKILRCGRDDSVGTRIGVIPRGVAVWLHARGARRKGFFGVVPEKGGFQAQGPVFYGVVPERGGFQARGSGFLWGRARKGWISGTGVRFSMGACPKGGCFSHECRLNFALAPQKCPVRRWTPAEVRKDSVQFCRTSIRIGVISQKSTEVRNESSKSFHTSC